jgi:KDO2-lipid IV(A) lauroyltransferase
MLDRLAYLGFAAFARFVRLLPLGMALALGAGIGRLMYTFVGRRRRVLTANLARAFPEKSEAERLVIAKASCRNLGRTLIEVLRLPDLTEADARERIRFEGAENFDTLRAVGKGALALSAHFGNFEYISVGANRLGLFRSHLIGRRIKNPYVDRAIQDLRRAHGVDTIPNKRSTPEILARLKRGEGIGVVLDQNMKRKVAVFVDFFGHSASTTPGLAVLAERSGAPVVPVFAVRESAWQAGGSAARHVITLGPPIPWEEHANHEEAVRLNTQRYTHVIEEWVRRFPDQWFWLHDRWRTQPLPAGATEAAEGGGGGGEGTGAVPAAGARTEPAPP